jgi:WD40 repeat protein
LIQWREAVTRQIENQGGIVPAAASCGVLRLKINFQNNWTWKASDAGAYRIEAQVRDAMHAGKDGLDDRRLERLEIVESETASEEKAVPEANPLIAVLGTNFNSKRSVAFSPDGMILASGSDDETIKLWNVSNGTVIRTLEEHSERGAPY